MVAYRIRRGCEGIGGGFEEYCGGGAEREVVTNDVEATTVEFRILEPGLGKRLR